VTLVAALFSADAKRLPTSVTSSASFKLSIMHLCSLKILNLKRVAEKQARDDICAPLLRMSALTVATGGVHGAGNNIDLVAQPFGGTHHFRAVYLSYRCAGRGGPVHGRTGNPRQPRHVFCVYPTFTFLSYPLSTLLISSTDYTGKTHIRATTFFQRCWRCPRSGRLHYRFLTPAGSTSAFRCELPEHSLRFLRVYEP